MKSCWCQLWIWRSQMQFYWRCEVEPVKLIFATVKSTIDTDNSSNTVLLFLFLWNSPNVYTLVGKHTNKWRNICTFQIPSAKKIVRQIHNWHRQLFKYSTVIPILPLNRQLMLWNFQIQYSYLYSKAILNITRDSMGWACVTHLSFCFEET